MSRDLSALSSASRLTTEILNAKLLECAILEAFLSGHKIARASWADIRAHGQDAKYTVCRSTYELWNFAAFHYKVATGRGFTRRTVRKIKRVGERLEEAIEILSGAIQGASAKEAGSGYTKGETITINQ
jgi:hypothetical protein